MKRIVALILLVFVGIGCSKGTRYPNNRLKSVRSYVVFYGDEWPEGRAPRADLYILHTTHHPPIEPLKARGGKVIGYVSVGEIFHKDPAFERIKAEGLIIDENPNWPGDFRIRIQSDGWQRFVLNELIPRTLSQGFDGIFIDTIDTAEYLRDDKRMADAVPGAARLINDIRKRFPGIVMVLNNGFFVLDRVGADIDGLLVEDIFTSYNFNEKTYNLASKAHMISRIVPPQRFHEKFGKQLFTLEYLNPTDTKDIELVVKRAREEGFIPYIADIHLETIFFGNE
jgi:uncharacterized protein (TIGR01370 family)